MAIDFHAVSAAHLRFKTKGKPTSPDIRFYKLVEEVGELAKEMRRDPQKFSHLSDEFGDVTMSLFNLADAHGIDLEKAVLRKIEKDGDVADAGGNV